MCGCGPNGTGVDRMGPVWTEWDRCGPCGHGNEPSIAINSRECVDYLRELERKGLEQWIRWK
jgi:hypothetical protein